MNKQAKELMEEIASKILEENPSISLKEFMRHVDVIMAVGSLPNALFSKYRYSGKTVEEVYEEITKRN